MIVTKYTAAAIPCQGCGRDLPIGAYYTRIRHGRSHLRQPCQDCCRAEQSRRRYQARLAAAETAAEQQRILHAAAQQRILHAAGGRRCGDCGGPVTGPGPRRYCDPCRARRRERHCAACGGPVTGPGPRRYCDPCRDRIAATPTPPRVRPPAPLTARLRRLHTRLMTRANAAMDHTIAARAQAIQERGTC